VKLVFDRAQRDNFWAQERYWDFASIKFRDRCRRAKIKNDTGTQRQEVKRRREGGRPTMRINNQGSRPCGVLQQRVFRRLAMLLTVRIVSCAFSVSLLFVLIFDASV